MDKKKKKEKKNEWTNEVSEWNKIQGENEKINTKGVFQVQVHWYSMKGSEGEEVSLLQWLLGHLPCMA